MPSTSQDMLNYMGNYHGPDFDDTTAIVFLEERGYVLRKDWHWLPKPGVVTYDDMTEDEYKHMQYLVEEWDFGGLKND